MDPISPTPPEPSETPGSRRERNARHVRRQGRVAFGALIIVAVLAAIGYGVIRAVDGDAIPTTVSGTSASASAAASSLAESIASVTATGATAAPDPVNGNTAVSTTAVVMTTTTLANLPSRDLQITANPEFVKLAITLQDGTVVTGKTPFSQEVPGGRIRIDFIKGGYNITSRDLVLDQDIAFKVWLDPEGQLYQSLVRFKCGPNPKQVAFTPDGEELWVSLLRGYGLEVYEPTTGEKLGGVKLGEHGAVEIIFTRDGKTIYAGQMETASVYEIDRETRTVTRHFNTGGSWTKVLLLSPDEKTLWASNWVSNDISEIDLVTGKLVRRIPTVVTPRGLYVTPDAKWLYVAGFENGDIQKIDLATGKGTVLIKTGGAMRHMVADDAGGRLYVDDMSTAEVYVVDLATDEVTKLADTDQRPNTMDLSPDGKVLYVSNRGKDNPKTYYIPGPQWGTILAIDTATGTVLDAIVGGNQCTGLDVSPDGKLLAFSDFLDNKIRVYTIPDYATLAAGGGGRADERFADMIKD
ncbi:MAG: YncE family protein [Actinomycetia bacterium]|nr:YncE family protein [Actinomycetes bacterium]